MGRGYCHESLRKPQAPFHQTHSQQDTLHIDPLIENNCNDHAGPWRFEGMSVSFCCLVLRVGHRVPCRFKVVVVCKCGRNRPCRSGAVPGDPPRLTRFPSFPSAIGHSRLTWELSRAGRGKTTLSSWITVPVGQSLFETRCFAGKPTDRRPGATMTCMPT